MKARLIILLVCTFLQTNCGNVEGGLHKSSNDRATQNKASNNSGIDKEAAIKVVKESASKSYSLDAYNIVSCDQDVFWRVFLEPKSATATQKGVEYIISKHGGWIVSQRELRLASATGPKENPFSKSAIEKEDAVNVAKKDGIAAYGSLAPYDLSICELAHVWIVIFSPKKGLDGGGPEYVIDKLTGKILEKRYYQ